MKKLKTIINTLYTSNLSLVTKYLLLTTSILLLTTYYCEAQTQIPTPAEKQKKPFVIYGGTIHVGNGEKIESGFIYCENGKIASIGKISEFKIDTSNIDVYYSKGKEIYPGFISTNNTLGLREIDAVRATRDFAEVGAMNPHVRALIAYNTESRVTMTVRSNGVLLTQATPRRGMISGQSSVMQLDAWNWEDAQVKADDGIHMNWPASMTWSWKKHKYVPNKNLIKLKTSLETLFNDAQGYGNAAATNIRLAAMQGLFKGEKNLYIHVSKAKEIIDAVEFAKKHKVKKIVIVGGRESHMISSYLKKNNIPVILQRVQALPSSEDEAVLTPYEIAKKLDEEGIVYCISYAGDMEAMNTRNLPFGAGISVSYGVDYEKAVASISLNAAKILGIENLYGSLEKGKSATLIISDGDALDIRTNNISLAFIDGRNVDLNNHQKELYNKFTAKYKQ